jgi:hypothetical protein
MRRKITIASEAVIIASLIILCFSLFLSPCVKDIKIGILPNGPIATNIGINVSMIFFTFTALIESALILKSGMS